MRSDSKIRPLLLAAAIGCASILVAPDSANAATALFRIKRSWWFSATNTWTDGKVTPRSGPKSYEPPAIAHVGSTSLAPGFTVPKSSLRNFEYKFLVPYLCPLYYYCTRTWNSYWNAVGSFRASNPNAPTTTTTIRMETTMNNWPPTAMDDPVTPTTTWGGRYDQSRGGLIRVEPGAQRFGGTMRFLYGPNHRIYALDWFDSSGKTGLSSINIRPRPLSQQLGTDTELAFGDVSEMYIGLRYRLTSQGIDRSIIGTTSMGGPEYYMRSVHYLLTHGPYTTGKVTVWDPNGNTSTFQTETGYDNRTPAGLNGTISLVHPRLFHAYTVFPESSGKSIQMTWSAARLQRVDFRFLPEPRGIALLASGLALLAYLRWVRRK